jgi:5-methylcytosine-specific restriction endonuclease McrA
MKALLNAHGYVTWNSTRSIVVDSVAFSEIQKDFGAGAENAATCPGCDRVLPTKCMHLDHILSQNRHSVSIAQSSDSLYLHSPTHPHDISDSYLGSLVGGIGYIHKIIPQIDTGRPRRASRATLTGQQTAIDTGDLWKSDLDNLQFICGSCNSTKGDRDFDVVFPTKVTRSLSRFLT